MAAGGAEDPSEPLQYQTMVLKVSIHCEGCRKKVKKVLQSIEGVYKTTIDAQNHKVTVTGNVEADTLVKRLLKTGKHAELWPSPDPIKPNSNGNRKKKNKAAGAQPTDKNPSFSAAAATDTTEKHGDAAEDDVTDGGGKEAQKSNGNPAPQPQTAAQVAAAAGGGGKKKGKKGQSNSGGGGGGGEAEAGKQEGGKAAAAPPHAGGLQPRPQSYNFPVTPPAYVLSYSTAQPSYGSAGYFPVQRSSYVYPHPGSYYIPPPPAVVEDDTFRTESADVCGIM